MRVLVACEYSGIVREAFKKRGHEAWSCDILPTEIEGNQNYLNDVEGRTETDSVYKYLYIGINILLLDEKILINFSETLSKLNFVLADISTINVSPDKSSAISSCSNS